ncbi:hypothetical protein IWW50_004642 [Coemansia erecta]|nr:hypothetical protein GGF43_002095 [Coemansia sp. RSA 2618]KAJ2821421.1 hypothetical protein IWW50_004642 [Coemansia erecta]
MDSEFALHYEADDSDTLRLRLHETTAQLQAAAHMGLELAQHNQSLTRRVTLMEGEHDELRQRLAVCERDRRWMHEQSLRVDQVRASVGELVGQAENARARRVAGEQRVREVDSAVKAVREDLDALVLAMQEMAGPHRWSKDVASVQKSIAEIGDRMDVLGARVGEMQERVDAAEGRQRSQTADFARQLANMDKRVAQNECVQAEAQAQAEWLAQQHHTLGASLESLSSEYRAMFNDHEQTIRMLGDHTHYPASAAASVTAPLTYANTSIDALQTPESAPRTGDARFDAVVLDATPVGQLARKRRTRMRDSGVAQVSYPYDQGESLGDIFAADSGQADIDRSTSLLFPSPPMSLASEQNEHIVRAHVPRKAASVIGTPFRTPRRPRQRVSSFSKLDNKEHAARTVVVSPTKMSPGFGGIIPAAAHVGVGWGNYWEARKQRVSLDIQARLGLSATSSAAVVCGNRPDCDSGDLDTAD